MRSTLLWAAGTAGVALTVAALLVPNDSDAYRRNEWGSRTDSLANVWWVARARVAMLNRVVARGEALETARAVRDVPVETPLLRIAPEIRPQAAQAIRERLDVELRAARAVPSKYPIAVLVQQDTALAVGGLYTQSIVLPSRPGEPCVIVLRLPRYRGQPWHLASNQRLLSTCAFYAAFGAPGEGTQRWLTETRANSARYYQLPADQVGTEAQQSRMSIASWGYHHTVVATLRCRRGDLAGCDELVGPDVITRESAQLMDIAIIDRTPLTTQFPGVETLRSGFWWEEVRLRSGILGALADDVGVERFGALWRDPRGLREAFGTESGTSFASWIAGYVAQRVARPSRGPMISTFSLVMALAIITAAVAIATTRAKRQML